MSMNKRDVVDVEIDNYIIKHDLVGKVPLTKEIDERRKNHKHDWQNGERFMRDGTLFIRCGQRDCPMIKSAFSNNAQDPTKPKKKRNHVISRRYQ